MVSGNPDFTAVKKSYVQKYFLPVSTNIKSSISSNRIGIAGDGNYIITLAESQAYYRQISSFTLFSQHGIAEGFVQYSTDEGDTWLDCCKAATSAAYVLAFEDFTEGPILQPNWLLRIRLYNLDVGAAYVHAVLNYTWESG